MTNYDPPPPPEGGNAMRATDLINKVCVFRPRAIGEWPAKEAADGKPAQKAQPYVECDVWVLDRAGILEEGTGVRVSWWKVYDQLAGADARPLGSFTTGKPQQEEGGRSIVLTNLEGDAAKVAAEVIPGLESQSAADDFVNEGTEPF